MYMCIYIYITRAPPRASQACQRTRNEYGSGTAAFEYRGSESTRDHYRRFIVLRILLKKGSYDQHSRSHCLRLRRRARIDVYETYE